MIPIAPQPPPADFDSQVAQPGNNFLASTPKPTREQWSGHDYWRRVLPHMCYVYNSICAYSCQRIEPTTGSHSVDHFMPKADHPHLAYTWSNYRLACNRLNARKRKQEILDPFTLAEQTFEILFPSLQVRPGPLCRTNDELSRRAWATINELKLNDETTCLFSRSELVKSYCLEEFSFTHLRKQHPFLALEMDRNGLAPLEAIRKVMSMPAGRRPPVSRM